MLTRREMLAGCGVLTAAVLAGSMMADEDEQKEDKVVVKEYKDCTDGYSFEECVEAADILNGLLCDIRGGGYKEGWRNNMMVDLTCAAFVLNMDAWKLVKEHGFELGEYSDADKVDARERIGTVEGYVESWNIEPGGVFDKMFDPTFWPGMDHGEEPTIVINND